MTNIIIRDNGPSLAPHDPRNLEPWTYEACRAIIERDGRIVFSFLAARDQYILPGGGLEGNETHAECVARECREELGFAVQALEHIAVATEYYDGILRFTNHYYAAGLLEGDTVVQRTDEEVRLLLQEIWLDKHAAIRNLLDARSHRAASENPPDHVLRAIANCHMRESIALALHLGKPWEQVLAAQGPGGRQISVEVRAGTVR